MVNSRDKGIRAELDVAKYLAANGLPDARRSVATGWSNATTEYQDAGDITGTPGLCFQVKNRAQPLVGKLLDDTWAETVRQAGDRMPLIVEKRAGTADPGAWWLYTTSAWYVHLLVGVSREWFDPDALVRARLGDVIEYLARYSKDSG